VLETAKADALDITIPAGVAKLEQTIQNGKDSVEDVIEVFTTARDKAATDYTASLAAWTENQDDIMANYLAEIDTQLATMNTKVDQLIEKELSSVEASIATALEVANDATTAATAKTEAAQAGFETTLAKYMDAQKVIWIGGTAKKSGNGGYRVFPTDRVELAAQGDYFAVDKVGKFTIKKTGLYKLVFWSPQYGINGPSKARIQVNGKCVTDNNYNTHIQGQGWMWRDQHIDFTWIFKAGEVVSLSLYSQYGQSWQEGKTTNRLIFSFEGTTTVTPKGKSYTCTNN
jgi:hypothetical protein